MFTRVFWLDAAERAGKAFAQTTLAAYGLTTFDADMLRHVVELGAVAAGLSVLTSMVSAKRNGTISPASLMPRTGRHARRP